ncbi:Peptidase C19, ubiquitin carboxyl-terminal hydrolase 2 [Artemisia annua]|uniref:Peptidase C19, ubiquitin carboxyl-terminal hydrolase 2 n=1 Tax=Artemisia annua TaxID=35608 RepID=A0A2U1K8K2_ARTAN|nr:Peptidase C19, ubiquitin carboxyl-terminal hydrolase 2 [Artemisia annua]
MADQNPPQVLLFGSFSEDEVRSWLSKPSENGEKIVKKKALDVDSLKISSEISFGSFNGESYKNIDSSKGIVNGNAASTLKNGKGSHTDANNNLKAEALVHPKQNGGPHSNGNTKLKPAENVNTTSLHIPSKNVPSLVSVMKEEKLNKTTDGPIPTDSGTCLLPRGLINSGNMCFLNATLQALLSCSSVVQLLQGLKARNVDKVCDIQVVIVH